MLANGIPFTRRLQRGELVALDSVAALVLGAICVLAAREVPTGEDPLREPVWLSWAVGLAIALPLAVRRLWPLTVCGVALATAAGALAMGVVPDYAAVPASVTVAYAVYPVGLTAARRASVVAVFTCLAGMTVALLVSSRTTSASADAASVAAPVLLIALGWLTGRATAERRANLERVSRERTARAVGEERLRIARELHDVVAHTMSLIAVKASVANHVADQRPEEARAALAVIEDTSRTALADIRRVLGVLRTDPVGSINADSVSPVNTDPVGAVNTNPVHGTNDDPVHPVKVDPPGPGHPADIDADRAPTPGLADLPALAARTSTAGLRVMLRMPPADAPVPPAVGRAVYRIVQESLTNVVKHANSATTCQATVAVEPGRLCISIVDDGGSVIDRATTHTGHGIIGMRERVAAYGGEFKAGPRPDGGFAVHALLPLGAP